MLMPLITVSKLREMFIFFDQKQGFVYLIRCLIDRLQKIQSRASQTRSTGKISTFPNACQRSHRKFSVSSSRSRVRSSSKSTAIYLRYYVSDMKLLLESRTSSFNVRRQHRIWKPQRLPVSSNRIAKELDWREGAPQIHQRPAIQ